VQSEPEENE
jgi:hypothetical protein